LAKRIEADKGAKEGGVADVFVWGGKEHLLSLSSKT